MCSSDLSPWVDGAKEFARIVGEKTGGAITLSTLLSILTLPLFAVLARGISMF